MTAFPLRDLVDDVKAHPAVNHMLLARLATGPYTRGDYRNFALQHYAILGFLTRGLEVLLLRAPTAAEKRWLSRVLSAEYGGEETGEEPATCYRRFLRVAGAEAGEELRIDLSPAVWSFVHGLLVICHEEPFWVGIGALGPGHKWALRHVFVHLTRGLRRAGFASGDIAFFGRKAESDRRDLWAPAVLEELARTPIQRQELKRGALASLDLCFELWTGIERVMVSWRQPESARAVRAGLFGPQRGGEVRSPGTLEDLRRAARAFENSRAWPVKRRRRQGTKQEAV